MGLKLKDPSAVTLPWLCSSGMVPEVAHRVPYAPKHPAAVWDRFLFSPLGQMEAGPGCSSVCWVSLMQGESAAMSGTLVSDRFTSTASLFLPSGRKSLEEKQGRKIMWADCYPSFSLLLENLSYIVLPGRFTFSAFQIDPGKSRCWYGYS